ncbi:MAG: hemerythrin domain-containing protein [Ilumatobacteraceae bacterium]
MTETMSAAVAPFYAIHRKMRIDTRRYVLAVETATEADRSGRLVPLAKWAAGFGRELHLHHTVEDDHFFPALVERCPEAGDILAGLEHDHEVVARILKQWGPAARDLADPTVDFEMARAEVLALAVQLRDLLAEHLDIEDAQIVPRLDEAFTEAELEAIDARVKKSLPKKGLSFAVPWNVEALDPATRDELVRTAPFILRLLYRIHAPRFARLVDEAFAGIPEPRID